MLTSVMYLWWGGGWNIVNTYIYIYIYIGFFIIYIYIYIFKYEKLTQYIRYQMQSLVESVNLCIKTCQIEPIFNVLNVNLTEERGLFV